MENFQCPVEMVPFNNQCVLTVDGYTYNPVSLNMQSAEHRGVLTSPLTRVDMTHSIVLPNHHARNSVAAINRMEATIRNSFDSFRSSPEFKTSVPGSTVSVEQMGAVLAEVCKRADAAIQDDRDIIFLEPNTRECLLEDCVALSDGYTYNLRNVAAIIEGGVSPVTQETLLHWVRVRNIYVGRLHDLLTPLGSLDTIAEMFQTTEEYYTLLPH